MGEVGGKLVQRARSRSKGGSRLDFVGSKPLQVRGRVGFAGSKPPQGWGRHGFAVAESPQGRARVGSAGSKPPRGRGWTGFAGGTTPEGRGRLGFAGAKSPTRSWLFVYSPAMADDRDEKKPKRKQKRATLRPSTKLGGSFWKTNNRIVLAMATISLLLLIGSGVRSKIKENHEKACQDAKVHVEAQFKAGNTGVASNYMSTLRTACGELDRSYVDSFDRTLKEREIVTARSAPS